MGKHPKGAWWEWVVGALAVIAAYRLGWHPAPAPEPEPVIAAYPEPEVLRIVGPDRVTVSPEGVIRVEYDPAEPGLDTIEELRAAIEADSKWIGLPDSMIGGEGVTK